MMKSISHRTSYFIGFLLIAVFLGGAAYLQVYMGVNPCPLCILQRLMMAGLGVAFLLGIACSEKTFGKITVGIASIAFSLLGIILSARQVWLQYLPATNNENCEVSLSYLLKVMPFNQIIAKVFAGGATCSQVGWQIFHVSLAEWSLVSFIVFLIFSMWQLCRRKAF